ncbi:prepilin-type N-terminal cleavage/methylation domain-containing protein [Campylobacter canadensis]|uniref:Prepilin-type N-terminal cleavage/methylation domain-containing protein n=1 Tax=Campylobacter canadensis TaxID=449520 RepID=A0ABS7WR08_9BACT|nr:prepilin-type N-terminal cleavage/methylation domain-containing protein [Campylobacter canadensis]MBZ7987197.1 prepilin-type N-terminal cleavage/methylation domain-containing protein [Campylobacter canadensis]MBZ7994451.1 prepilin-type N-terminal cleavage/methylation domain-containing protein [Campylobacter canadensis]MBZ7996462.1 prepilin-type N-terminal cleavage/methylation domain-containing protein [Campylobacter canadensis]MBZ7998179.1 prepilin-type N-terminal cleavage/methylation domain
MKKYSKNKKAVSMIELIVVIVVIGVLSASALVSFFDFRFKGDIKKLQSEVNSVNTYLQTKLTENIFKGDYRSTTELTPIKGKNTFAGLVSETGFKKWTPVYENKKKSDISDGGVTGINVTNIKNRTNDKAKTSLFKYEMNPNVTFYFSYNDYSARLKCEYVECKVCTDKKGSRKKLINNSFDCENKL